MGSSALMTIRIAFLRAVNVGKRTVNMSRLVEVFEALGYTDVSTFINSGNIVFDASGARADVERAIERALEAEYGFEVTTFVRTAGELGKMLDAAPFEVADADTYFVTFLKSTPSTTTVRTLEAYSNDFDTLVVRGRDVHWRMHGRSIDTTVTKTQWNVVGKLASTSRNVNSLRKLLAKIEKLST
jgi:uncharacterized protein (DUF1697 family)